MPTRVTSQTAGSWFPSGYYGHYRSRVRVDYQNEFRQLSKPQPPQRFLSRSVQPAATHQFSLHDNRHSFMNDASYFAQGLGKKRHPERSGGFDPHFVSWSPNKVNAKSGRPLTSTYRSDFQRRQEQAHLQLLTQRPKTSFDTPISTTYRSVHGCESPNRDFINAMNNEALMLSAQSRQRQAKLKKSNCRETVASCLSWYHPRIPPATGITDFDHIDLKPSNSTDYKVCDPHPPSYPPPVSNNNWVGEPAATTTNGQEASAPPCNNECLPPAAPMCAPCE